MGAATVASSSSSSSLLYPLLSLLLISSTTSARLLITLATVSAAAASATAATAAATVDDDSSAVDHYEAAPCHHRGTRYPHPHHPHHHHHHLPHIHHRRISTHRLLAAPPPPLHHHHLTRVHHLGRGDEWLPLPPQGPGFWAEESPPPIIDTGGGGGGGEPGYNVVPVVRLVETYGGQRGGGDGGALGGLGGGEGGGGDGGGGGGGEGVSMEENLGTQEQFRGGGGGGGNSQSPQVESVKDPILISTKLPTDAADSSAESQGSSSNTDNRANQAREYGGHNSGVTYTRFHLPDPNELITGDPPSSSVSGAAPHLPGVIYRLESPTLIGGHHHHHPLPGPPMNELPKTTNGKKKSKKRKNKGKNKVTKLTLNPYVATTADPNQFGNNNNSPYSVNKIIVIEEDGAVGIGPPPGLVESSQIERPQLTSEFQHQNQQNLKDTFQPVHRVHFPQNRPQSVQTIKTIKDLHDQLNVSLFQNQNQQQETQTTTMSPIIAELIEKLNSGNSAGVPPTTTTTPLFKNNSTLENSALASKHFTGSSGYFVKANRFQFQNSWTSTEAPPTSSSTTAVTPPVVYFTSQRNFAPTPAKTTPQPPSPSSTSTTIITSTPTPTTLAIPATVRVITTSPTSTTGVHSLHPPPHHHPPNHHLHHHQSRPEIMSARKHGTQSGSQNGGQESSSAHQLSAATTVDMSQVASIIIGFCVAMMALAGVILMVLHRDTVTGQLRTFRENLESRYPNLALNRNGNGPPPNPPNSSQPSSSSSSSSSIDFNSHHQNSSIVHSHQGEPRRVSVPIPPPPPPPPLPPQSNPPQPNQEHLIEQIIGRPAETGHFTNKKCRQYFSRVHRWVPKRPPLPESCDLKSTAVTRINL